MLYGLRNEETHVQDINGVVSFQPYSPSYQGLMAHG